MKVDQYAIQMAQQHSLQQSSRTSEKLSIWQVPRQPPSTPSTQLPPSPPPPAAAPASDIDDVAISPAARKVVEEEQQLSPRLSMMKQILESTFGVKLQEASFEWSISGESSMNVATTQSGEMAQKQTDKSGSGSELAMRFEREFHYKEEESWQFSASGQITTADGRDLSFSLDVSISRSFEIRQSETFNFGAATKDPLMLTLDQQAGDLAGAKVQFDLDGDGKDEWLPMARNGGWLVVDKNGDGKVNDRSELFGPQSGNGFGELAALDNDGNGLIDKRDPLFARLRLWQGHEDGKDQLAPLEDLQISALLLRHTDTSYRYADAQGQTQAQLRKAGVYLTEAGKAGLISQLDINA